MRASEQHVFISYARRDAANLALRLQKDLTSRGFDVWLDTRRIAGGTSWTADIESAIDHAAVVLAVLSRGAYESDICRAEQLRSMRKGKQIIPVVAQSGVDIPLHLETKDYRDFTRAGTYEAQLRLLVRDIRDGRKTLLLRPEFRTTLVTAPPLPQNYLDRPDTIASLRDAILTDDPGPSAALIALDGMGGIGKTILAQAVSRDETVQNAFPDGIVWTTPGKEPAYSLNRPNVEAVGSGVGSRRKNARRSFCCGRVCSNDTGRQTGNFKD